MSASGQRARLGEQVGGEHAAPQGVADQVARRPGWTRSSAWPTARPGCARARPPSDSSTSRSTRPVIRSDHAGGASPTARPGRCRSGRSPCWGSGTGRGRGRRRRWPRRGPPGPGSAAAGSTTAARDCVPAGQARADRPGAQADAERGGARCRPRSTARRRRRDRTARARRTRLATRSSGQGATRRSRARSRNTPTTPATTAGSTPSGPRSGRVSAAAPQTTASSAVSGVPQPGRRLSSTPASAATATATSGDHGEQEQLVVGAERRDRRVLGPRRREVDDEVGDGEHRRGARAR